jgi:hypothetical protein
MKSGVKTGCLNCGLVQAGGFRQAQKKAGGAFFLVSKTEHFWFCSFWALSGKDSVNNKKFGFMVQFLAFAFPHCPPPLTLSSIPSHIHLT